MLTAIAVDDVPECLYSVQELVATHEHEVKLLDSCSSVSEAFKSIQKHQPDILFLDVQIHAETGFDLLDLLGEVHPYVIFTTAYDKYATRAFEVNALHYLKKPIEAELFTAAIERAKQIQHADKVRNRERIKEVAEVYRNPKEQMQHIYLDDQDASRKVALSEIEFVKAGGNSCLVHLSSGQRIYQSKTLKKVSDVLEPEGFLRIHKSYLIHPEHFTKFHKRSKEIELRSGMRLPIARARFEHVKMALGFWFQFFRAGFGSAQHEQKRKLLG